MTPVYLNESQDHLNESLQGEVHFLFRTDPTLEVISNPEILERLKNPLRDEKHLVDLSKRIHPVTVQDREVIRIRETSGSFLNPRLTYTLSHPVFVTRFITFHFHEHLRFFDILDQFPKELKNSATRLYYTTELSSIQYTPIQRNSSHYTLGITHVWTSEFMKPRIPPTRRDKS